MDCLACFEFSTFVPAFACLFLQFVALNWVYCHYSILVFKRFTINKFNFYCIFKVSFCNIYFCDNVSCLYFYKFACPYILYFQDTWSFRCCAFDGYSCKLFNTNRFHCIVNVLNTNCKGNFLAQFVDFFFMDLGNDFSWIYRVVIGSVSYFQLAIFLDDLVIISYINKFFVYLCQNHNSCDYICADSNQSLASFYCHLCGLAFCDRTFYKLIFLTGERFSVIFLGVRCTGKCYLSWLDCQLSICYFLNSYNTVISIIAARCSKRRYK